MTSLQLPNADRSIQPYRLTGTPIPLAKRGASDFNRVAFAAGHVVADPFAENDPC